MTFALVAYHFANGFPSTLAQKAIQSKLAAKS